MFVGITRFSLFNPDSTAWVASRGTKFVTADEYKNYLYSKERMEDRCEIFLSLTIPMLERAAEGHLLAHIVSYSSAMPSEYKEKLRQAANRYSFLVLDEVEDGGSMRSPHRLARTIMAEHGMDRTSPFGTYRLDDDDVLSVDYFDQMAAHIIPEKVGHVVSLGHGLTGIYIDGEYRWVRKIYRPLLALGLLSICRFNADGNLSAPIGSAHTHSARFNPVIQDDRKLSFFWTRSLTQDTMLHYHGADASKLLSRILYDFKNYEIPGDEAGIAFPILGKRIHMDPIES